MYGVYNRSVRERLIQVALVFLILVSLCGPVFEMFDHWDKFLQGGSDIVLTLLALGICLGLVLSLFRSIVDALFVSAQRLAIQFAHIAIAYARDFLPTPASFQSPPSALRI